MMQKEQKALISIIRSTITHEPYQLKEIDPQALLNEAFAQAVPLTVCSALCEYVTGTDKEKIKILLIKWLAQNTKVEYSQNQLVDLLEHNGFSYVILKGLSAACYYPNPRMRMLGDVDFLIDPEKKNEIENLLVSEGYEKSHDGHACHVVFRKPNAHLEMHFEPAGIPSGEIGEKVRTFLKDAVASHIERDIDNGKFYAPQDKYHALILLLHMQHHMLGEGIGLRHLCDWAYFVNATCNKEFWNELVPFLQEIGLLRFASVMTQVCEKYFAIKCPNFAENPEPELCDKIIEDIFSGGNFGKKDKTRSEGYILVSNRGKTGGKHGKIYYLFYALNAYVSEHFYRFRKIYVLYPVFYLYAGIKYISRVVSGQRTPMHKLVSSANKRKELFENLRVFERD